MSKFSFQYGKNNVMNFKVSDKKILGELEPDEISPIKNFEEEFLKSLKFTSDDTSALGKKLNENGNVSIVVNDKTRSWNKQSEYLPILLDKLNEFKIPDKRIRVVIGLGSHEKQTEEENVNLFSKEVVDRVEIIQNESKNDEELVQVGTTSYGTEVKLNKTVVQSENVILTGGISIHHFAGFSGGRKSVLPAISGYKSIQQNHKLWLDPEKDKFKESTKGGFGTLEGNIISEDMEEAASLLNPDFLINIIVSKDKDPIKIVSGNYLIAHKKGCNYIKEVESETISEKSDLVIASAGGYPKDINLYQATKAIFNSIKSLKPRGTLIIAAGCGEGVGNQEFYKFTVEDNKFEEKMQLIQQDFTIPKGVALYLNKCTEKYNIILVSNIDNEKVNELGMKPSRTIKNALEALNLDKINTIYLIPYGVNVLPIIS